MKSKIKKLWLAALRSDKYKQCKGQLRNRDSFCCLGVLCDVHRRLVGNKRWHKGYYFKEFYCLPQQVTKWADLKKQNPILPGNTTLGAENDAGKTFIKIADLIEKHL